MKEIEIVIRGRPGIGKTELQTLLFNLLTQRGHRVHCFDFYGDEIQPKHPPKTDQFLERREITITTAPGFLDYVTAALQKFRKRASADFSKIENEPAIKGGAFSEFFAAQREVMEERSKLATEAREKSLPLLINAMCQKTGQSRHIRALLFSLWNGKPASAIELIALDWKLRVALLNVFAAFGFEQKGGPNFFYDELKQAVSAAGLWEWFIAAAEVEP